MGHQKEENGGKGQMIKKQFLNMEKELKRILCVIDMQNDFISGSLGSEDAAKIVPAVIRKIGQWKGTVIATRDTHEDENYLETQEGRILPVKHCIRNTWGWEIESGVAEALNSSDLAGIIDKGHFAEASEALATSAEAGNGESGQSGFRTLPELIKALAGTSDVEITLIGLCTDICVVSNALMLKSMFPEQRFIVDSACCAGLSPESHQSALTVMKSCQIEVIPWQITD